MADLSFIEKRNLEKLLRMEGGYVLSFSDRTFREFIIDSVERDIDNVQYRSDDSNSKAKRFRRFLSLEPNYIVGKLIYDLIGVVRNESSSSEILPLVEKCEQTAKRLLECFPDKNVDEPSQSSPNTLSISERLKLLQTLSALPTAQFEEIVFSLKPPSGNIPGGFAPQSSRSKELLTWLESPLGPGLTALEAVLEAIFLSQDRSVKQHFNQSQYVEHIKKLVDTLKVIQNNNYDFRGATFGGGFAETVEGDQHGTVHIPVDDSDF